MGVGVRRSTVSQVCLAALLAAAGVLITAQLRTQRRLRGTVYDRGEQAILMSELVDVNRRLRDEIESLTAQQAAYQADNRETILEELVAELNRVRALNGAAEVTGPGIELLVDGSLNALDLQDLVNELRNAGAEAVALNGQRLVVSSVVVSEDSGLLAVDGRQLRRPYVVEAVGDSETLKSALMRPGGLIQVLGRSVPNLAIQIGGREQLVLDVYQPWPMAQYTQPLD